MKAGVETPREVGQEHNVKVLTVQSLHVASSVAADKFCFKVIISSVSAIECCFQPDQRQ